MKVALSVFFWTLGVLISPLLASYEAAGGHGHSQYAGGGAVGWSPGHGSGSYYHYHVPVVGSNGHHESAHHYQQSSILDSHLIWLLIPLLLLALLPLLLLALLPLLLIPLGLSLLALIMPLLMMPAAAMMMMMASMMMSPMSMMMSPMMKRDLPLDNPAELWTTGKDLLESVLSNSNETGSIVDTLSKSIGTNLDQCLERTTCEIAKKWITTTSNKSGTASIGTNTKIKMIMDLIPKQVGGVVQDLFSVWNDISSKDPNAGQINCEMYKCDLLMTKQFKGTSKRHSPNQQ